MYQSKLQEPPEPLLPLPLLPQTTYMMALELPSVADHLEVEVEEEEEAEDHPPDNPQPNLPHLDQWQLLVTSKIWDNSHCL